MCTIVKELIPVWIRTYLKHPKLVFSYRRDGIAMTERNLLEITLLRFLPQAIQERYERAKGARVEANWLESGRPTPPPHVIKIKRIEQAAQKFGLSTFVETGTYKGDLIHALQRKFTRIYSIEVDQRLYQRAVKRFAKQPHILLRNGDSGQALSRVLAEIEQPCLFWLDAHFSGGITGKADLETPVLAELQALSARHQADVILIDDARCFNGSHDFPTLGELREIVSDLFPEHSFSVSDDIISMIPCSNSRRLLS